MATKQEMLILALAVKQGLIDRTKAQECVDEQMRREDAGKPANILDIAIEMGILTAEQAESLTGGMPEPAEAPMPGGDKVSLDQARLIKIFDVQKEVGQGGMASVFLATDKRNNQRCALKVLFPKHTRNKVFVERFMLEGKLLKEFDSPNIARGYEFGVAQKEGPVPLYFMSMEYINGVSIQDMLDKEGSFPETKAIHVITEAAKGLAYMQEKGYVHKDVKPDNIMWNKDGRVMLVDLGFAAPIRGDLKGKYLDETCGTVQYISPEQAKGQADVDIRADIYSLGATLYHMVIGKLPFAGQDQMEIMSKQVMENLDAHMLKGGKISMHMHYFIEKMMAKDRDIRYQTARQIVDDIGEVLKGAADMVYDPSNDPGNPFALGTGSGRNQRSPSASIRSLPANSTSVRNPIPGAGSVRAPVANPGGSTTSIRRPVLPGGSGVHKKPTGQVPGAGAPRPVLPGSSSRSVPPNGNSGRAPLPPGQPPQRITNIPAPAKPAPPAPAKVPVGGGNGTTSVRLPAPGKPGSPPSVRMPEKRKPGQ
ncbi:MAG: protein kinase [Planctomycetes bacterium]|nr:protein kinase [Planctomycetota bacterium]